MHVYWKQKKIDDDKSKREKNLKITKETETEW